MEDSARVRLAPTSSRSGNGHTPIAEPIVEQAISWYVRLASGMMTPQDREAFHRWQAAHADHARAWERLSRLGGRLQDSAARVAPDVTRATMLRLAARSGRRRTLKTLAWMGAGGIGLYVSQERLGWRGTLTAAMSDLHTATGERRDLVLADGTQLRLNTGTAVDVRYHARERRIVLHGGEIMIATAVDPAGRPLVVSTADGALLPMGTRFTVRRVDTGDARFTQVAVNEGAVEIHTRRQPKTHTALLQAGQQARFTHDRIEPALALDHNSQAWLDGILSAENMRLADFLAELNRYRSGWLRVAPEAAGLRITGAWPLDGPDPTQRILDSLERRLPIRVTHYTRYWVMVTARPSRE